MTGNRTGGALWVVVAILAGGSLFGAKAHELRTRAAVLSAVVIQPEQVCGECDSCLKNIDGTNYNGHDFSAAQGGTNTGNAAHPCYAGATICRGQDGHFLCGQSLSSATYNREGDGEKLATMVYAATFDESGAAARSLLNAFPDLARAVDGGAFIEVRRPCDPRVVEALIPIRVPEAVIAAS